MKAEVSNIAIGELYPDEEHGGIWCADKHGRIIRWPLREASPFSGIPGA